MMYVFTPKIYILTLITTVTFRTSLQYCPEEVSKSGITVTWYQSDSGYFIRSDPLCIHKDLLITRNCSNNEWIPPLSEIVPCHNTSKYLDHSSCPPGFKTISYNHTRYCYQIENPSPWDYPCFASGGATVITELDKNEIHFLLHALNTTSYRYFWLPARRQKTLDPVVWLTPGPNWGRSVNTSKALPYIPSFFKNCLLVDTQIGVLLSGACSNEYPSLCFYKNDFHHPAKCPNNYHAFRYMLDDGRCFGIEQSDTRLTFQEFLSRCRTPMGNIKYNPDSTFIELDLRRHVYTKIAETNNFTDDTWCWFAAPLDSSNNSISEFNAHVNIFDSVDRLNQNFFNVINNNGLIALMDSASTLPCMACETNIVYAETELAFEYNEDSQQLFLTVYSPSGLWRYNSADIGVQCFSDADGFSKVIDINSFPIMDTKSSQSSVGEQVIYVVDLVTDTSARYWCEGHTKSFTLISTEKIVVNPQGNQLHVFPLVLKLSVNENKNIGSIMSDLMRNITLIFKPVKALVMDILEYNLKVMQVLIHLHMSVNNTLRDESKNIERTFDFLKTKVELEFPIYNYTFVNMSSAVYCLPTTSINSIQLVWNITPIGHIASPLQFCLQANGLPVNRQCLGSYLLGSFWGKVEGLCDVNYSPSNTTKFLFDFTKRRTKDISKFLTEGLEYVLDDLNILIPADIYYLSLSLQYVLDTGKQNMSSIETGDITNMAWIMDRMMSINNTNLHLAQTLNSTNSILESTSNIIELITINNVTALYNTEHNIVSNQYQLAVKPRFILQISYPKLNNVTGIAVIRIGDSSNFTDMIIKPLFINTTLSYVSSIKNLEVATWLPYPIMNNLKKLNNESSNENNSMHIVIKVYSDNSVFQELRKIQHIVNSRIIEITIPGYNKSFEYPIPLLFKEIHNVRYSKVCGYWDFRAEKGSIPGSWSKRGCFVKTSVNNLTMCECFHLTHFAKLFNIQNGLQFENSEIDEKHDRVLNIITLIGSFLSLLGIVGIWVTAIVLDSWRRKTGTKVLLQLSISIALPLILIIVFILDNTIIVEKQAYHVVPENMIAICIILGALFHYSVLANFIWMLITAILQFIRYVRVLGVSRPSRFMRKLAIIGWGLPAIPVAIVLLIDHENYVPGPSRVRLFCYPNGLYMIAGIIVPVCVVLIINVTLFILVIKSISKSSKSTMQATDKSLVLAQFRLSIFLFFLLGLTWIFGVASFSGNLVWSYLFCLTSTVQGLVLFIYFIICDPNTRNRWITVMKPQFNRSRISVTTISSN